MKWGRVDSRNRQVSVSVCSYDCEDATSANQVGGYERTQEKLVVVRPRVVTWPGEREMAPVHNRLQPKAERLERERPALFGISSEEACVRFITVTHRAGSCLPPPRASAYFLSHAGINLSGLPCLRHPLAQIGCVKTSRGVRHLSVLPRLNLERCKPPFCSKVDIRALSYVLHK